MIEMIDEIIIDLADIMKAMKMSVMEETAIAQSQIIK